MFSPYYAWTRAVSAQAAAESFVSLNVALYTPRGKHWCMTERGRARLWRDASHLGIGPSALTWTGRTLVVDIDEVAVPFPRRVRGRIELTPNALTAQAYALDPSGRHAWSPLVPQARVRVFMQQPDWQFDGHGYLDCNWGCEPLEAAFSSWTWSRTPFGAATLLQYDARLRDESRRSLALAVDAHGSVEPVELPAPVPLPSTAWRLSRTTRSEGLPRVVRALEDGPFYARASLESRWRGATAVGMHEVLSLDRFRKRLVQAMLPFRMPRALS